MVDICCLCEFDVCFTGAHGSRLNNFNISNHSTYVKSFFELSLTILYILNDMMPRLEYSILNAV